MSEVYDLNRIQVPDAPPDYEDHAREPHFVPAPCQVACPVGTDAPSYIAYIWEENWERAFEAITATNPFSSICGRVCDAPCEPACRRVQSDGPLAIRNLKRVVMDRLGESYRPPAHPVTRKESIGIVGGGPCGLTAAHDLALAGYEVHVYEMSDRLGGMMVWGIPAFRLPVGIIQEDLDRLFAKCPGIKAHLDCELGKDVTLDELKARHDAVLLTIGSWWGKPMGIPGEDGPRVVDGVSFLRRVNAGERPALPETVVVVGGGDVAMDACRSALRMPGCERVKVVYRRGPDEIPARKDELDGAIKEGIEFVYNTLQRGVIARGDGLALQCVRTEMGEPDPEDGRRRPVVVEGSEHEIDCGMLIAAVGQQAESAHLAGHGLMDRDRVRADFDGMRTADPKVFAAGDGAFGGSTIVLAMSHGQRAAYYIKARLEGIEDPLPYRTPYRTRRVPVAQDIMWERFPRQEQAFHGLGDDPAAFPEIESGYGLETAKAEAARCYRCDAETGSTDYSVAHREDIFSMARTNPNDVAKLRAMLRHRLEPRANPFPEGRPPTLDDLAFLPANLSRLVIDPYREACRVDVDLGHKLHLDKPFFVAGFDEAPPQVWDSLLAGLKEAGCGYLGRRAPGPDVAWLQLIASGTESPSEEAAGLLYKVGVADGRVAAGRLRDDQVMGFAVASPEIVADTVARSFDEGCDVLLLDGTRGIETPWPELAGAPDLSILRDAVKALRALKKEGDIDLVYFGGARSGTDAAKLIALGASAVVYGVPVGLAMGGRITAEGVLGFGSDYGDDDRRLAVANILKASVGEASMMARCTGKTNLHNVEPEDMRAITLASAEHTGIPLVGPRARPAAE
jgi:NADPH-dependent glutamate synthase beta subunit-like oxidoreductase